MAVSKSTGSGKSDRYPLACETSIMRSSERPATHICRPVSRATSPNVCRRATLLAKVVTSTRLPECFWTSSRRPLNTAPSEPLGEGLNTLVLSQTSARTPSSPISVNSSSVAGSPIMGSSSSFQSPVWKIFPCGVSITKALPSAIECASGM